MIVDLGLLCDEGMKSLDCAKKIAPSLKSIFLFIGIVLFVILIARLIFAIVKVKKKQKVFWVGFVLTDAVIMILLLIFYLLIPYMMVWFNIV